MQFSSHLADSLSTMHTMNFVTGSASVAQSTQHCLYVPDCGTGNQRHVAWCPFAGTPMQTAWVQSLELLCMLFFSFFPLLAHFHPPVALPGWWNSYPHLFYEFIF